MTLDPTFPRPAGARAFTSTRRIRLADVDVAGRVRLDALARLLQDAAIDDVAETGWGAPEHLWFVRRMRIDVVAPLLADRTVELETWCSGVSALAAGRRWTVTGDAGGRAEVDSVWVHLDRDGRPERIGDFGVYAWAAGGRQAITRFELPAPPAIGSLQPWPLRSADADLHGHVNNAVHWEAVEDLVVAPGLVDPSYPHRAELEYRLPVEPDDPLAARVAPDGVATLLWLVVRERICASARLEPLAAP